MAFITNFIQRKGANPIKVVYRRIRKRNPHIDILVTTYQSVDETVWKKAIQTASTWRNFTRNTKEGKMLLLIDDAIRELEDSVKYDALEAYAETGEKRLATLTRQDYEETIKTIALAEVRATYLMEEKNRQIEAENERELQRARQERRNADVLAYLHRRIEGMRNGTIKNKGNNYEKGTCKAWSTFEFVITGFMRVHPFTWADINTHLTDDFLNYLNGYMGTTANKQLTMLRALAGYAYADGLHTNAVGLKCFTKRRIQEADKAREIYLTMEELQALYDMPLAGLKAQMRDVFLVGCYTCQRFSDYSRLKEDNFTTTARGTKVVKLIQEKTNTPVVIPILNDNLITIAKRYEYNLPKVSDVVLNRYIKEILCDLSQSVPSLAKEEVTTLTMTERKMQSEGKKQYQTDAHGNIIKPRWAMVSTHTARRSGITNLYLTGKFDTMQMMSISGHKDLATFREYIKLSSEEIADEIAKIAEETTANIVNF